MDEDEEVFHGVPDALAPNPDGDVYDPTVSPFIQAHQATEAAPPVGITPADSPEAAANRELERRTRLVSPEDGVRDEPPEGRIREFSRGLTPQEIGHISPLPSSEEQPRSGRGGPQLTFTREQSLAPPPSEQAARDAQAIQDQEREDLRVVGGAKIQEMAQAERVMAEWEDLLAEDTAEATTAFREGMQTIRHKNRELEQLSREVASQRIDPSQFYSDRGSASRFAAGINIAVGAIASIFTGGPNTALRIINDAVERDISAQEFDQGIRESGVQRGVQLLDRLTGMLGNEQAGRDALRALRYQEAQVRLTSLAARTNNVAQRQQINNVINLLQERASLAQDQARREAASVTMRGVFRGRRELIRGRRQERAVQESLDDQTLALNASRGEPAAVEELKRRQEVAQRRAAARRRRLASTPQQTEQTQQVQQPQPSVNPLGHPRDAGNTIPILGADNRSLMYLDTAETSPARVRTAEEAARAQQDPEHPRNKVAAILTQADDAYIRTQAVIQDVGGFGRLPESTVDTLLATPEGARLLVNMRDQMISGLAAFQRVSPGAVRDSEQQLIREVNGLPSEPQQILSFLRDATTQSVMAGMDQGARNARDRALSEIRSYQVMTPRTEEDQRRLQAAIDNNRLLQADSDE